MFTGIIETIGKVVEIKVEGGNKKLTIESDVSNQLKVDQSVSHNGVCLTVVSINGNQHTIDVVAESLSKTNIGALNESDIVNIERCVSANSLMDGHIVQGHVDEVLTCIAKEAKDGSHIFKFGINAKNAHLLVGRGSVCINGVSLTIAQLAEEDFSVAIIPYTYEHTQFKSIKMGSKVNIEYDIVGKYLARFAQTNFMG